MALTCIFQLFLCSSSGFSKFIPYSGMLISLDLNWTQGQELRSSQQPSGLPSTDLHMHPSAHNRQIGKHRTCSVVYLFVEVSHYYSSYFCLVICPVYVEVIIHCEMQTCNIPCCHWRLSDWNSHFESITFCLPSYSQDFLLRWPCLRQFVLAAFWRSAS